MWQAHLAPSDIEAVLQVIIQRDAFFTSTAPRYGSRTLEQDDDSTPGSTDDDDERLLTVAANGQQKQVVLQGKPATWATNDTQTDHVFAVEAFLLAYHPVHSVLAAPNPDPDRLSHETD
jgi:hypothetical protein